MGKLKLFFGSWKTTVPGVLALLCATDSAFLQLMPEEWETKATALCTFLLAIGLIAAKDADKTGTGKSVQKEQP
jgi:hypothetical protein